MRLKNIFLTLVIVCISMSSYSQTFEEYKKKEGTNYKRFEEKRDQELKQFIANEENWNLITTEEKGIVKFEVPDKKNTETKIKEEATENIPVTKPNTVTTIAKSTSAKKTININPLEGKTKIKEEATENIPATKPNTVTTIAKSTSLEKSGYIHPLSGSTYRLSSTYGFRTHPVYKTRRFHSGIDLGTKENTPILSIESGTVVSAGFARGYGNYVVIKHNGGIKSAYAHMNKILVTKGEKVNKEDKIGLVGMTGTATGNHLHFEIIKNNKKINPLKIISE
jgi:murein DD-endopeptidase MepM/ murein hydrolase activator NlpD